MCKCTPNIKTPFCGKPGCEWPHKSKNKRNFIISDKTSGKHIEISIDEEREFLEVWPIEHNGKKNIVIQVRIHPFDRAPFVIYEKIHE